VVFGAHSVRPERPNATRGISPREGSIRCADSLAEVAYGGTRVFLGEHVEEVSPLAGQAVGGPPPMDLGLTPWVARMENQLSQNLIVHQEVFLAGRPISDPDRSRS
jgi:hypothetical protein